MNNGLVKVEVLNFKKVRLIEIVRSDDGVTVIGGDNAQGKSALLEAIRYLYGGKKMVTGDLIRNGAEDGYVVGHEADGTVTKVILGSGTKTIKRPGEKAVSSGAQKVCDDKGHFLSYDPSEFFNRDAAFQTNTILQLHGISFDHVDTEYDRVFNERTIINRDVTRTMNALADFKNTTVIPANEPPVPESSDTLLARRNDLSAEVLVIQNRATAIEEWRTELDGLKKRVAVLEENIRVQELLPTDVTEKNADIAKVDEAIASISSASAMRTAWIKHQVLQNEYAECSKQSGDLTTTLDSLKEQKRSLIDSVQWSIRGLGYDDEKKVITWNGRPMSETSDGERVLIGVALVMALDKSCSSLKVLLLQNAAFLDEKNRNTIKKMANKHGWWVIMEVPSKVDCDIVIEDGEIKKGNE